MIFKVKATVLRELWNGGGSYLYQVQETISEDRTKNWAIFTKTELEAGQEAVFEGYVSESKDKKRNDQNGKAIYQTSYNAESVILTEDVDPHFNTEEDIPF